ncbi:hypothetical protein ACFPRL_04875 [Pseudoclavibacter helvolus]
MGTRDAVLVADLFRSGGSASWKAVRAGSRWSAKQSSAREPAECRRGLVASEWRERRRQARRYRAYPAARTRCRLEACPRRLA